MFCAEFKRQIFQLLESHNYNMKVVMKDVARIKPALVSGLAGYSSLSASNNEQPNTTAARRFSMPCTTDAELQQLEDIYHEDKFQAIISCDVHIDI